MKLNRKGFTLIELLAVIVLLITISAIAIPSITASIERSKARQADAKKQVIVEAAKLYYSDHKASLSQFINGECYISVGLLGLTDKELENPITNRPFAGGVIYINTSGEFVYADDTNVSACRG